MMSRARIRLLTLLLLAGAGLWWSSCQQSDTTTTELVFALDSAQIGKFDSLRIEVFPSDTADSAVWTKSLPLTPTQTTVSVTKPTVVGSQFTVVITGFSGGSASYKKQFQYLDGHLDSTVTPATLLRDITVADASVAPGDTFTLIPVFIPPDAVDTQFSATSSDSTKAKVLGHRIAGLDSGTATIHVTAGDAKITKSFALHITRDVVASDSLTVADLTGPLYDTLRPALTWWPANTTQKGFALSSLDTSVASVIDTAFLARKIGGTRGVAVAAANGVRDTFAVTVRAPNFSDIQPITKQWCGQCHGPDVTFNLQDSSVLVSKGSKALVRLNLPVSDTGYMPANKAVLPPRDKQMLVYWLLQNVKPVTGLTVNDTTVDLGDSVVPALQWTPSNATDKNYTLLSANTGIAQVSGGALLIYDTGTVNITVTSDDGGLQKTFKVKAGLPDFATRIKPITTAECGECHSPLRTFNLQDSAVLVQYGAETLRRIQLPVSSPDHMPADTALKLSTRQLKAMLGWLNAFYLKLDSVAVDSLTLHVGETKSPVAHFYPSNASDRNYHLVLAVTDTTKVTSPDGLHLYGKALTTSPTTVILETEESSLQKAFAVSVAPVPVDSIRVVDTGGAIGDTVMPRVMVYPQNATDTTWGLAYLAPTPAIAVVSQGVFVVGKTQGTAQILVTSHGTAAAKDTLQFAVGPVRVDSIKVADQTVTVGAEFSPAITWYPSTATNKAYTLQSAADSIVSVVNPASSAPQLQANGVGTATVTIDATDKDYVTQFKVTVGNVTATAIKLTLTGPIYADSPMVADTPALAWTPTNTTLKTYTLSTGTPSLVQVRNTGTPVFFGTALGTGSITATSADGPRDSATFTIWRPPFSKVQGIINARCAACHAGLSGGLPKLDSAHALDVSTYNPPNLVKQEIVRRIELPVTNTDHMPANGTSLITDTLAIMVRYFSW